MSTITLKKAQWLWEDYTGAEWDNLRSASTGDGFAAYAHLAGYDSKYRYRPKSLFYYYFVNGIDSSTHKLSSVKFIVVFGKKTSTKTNDLPSLKVFSGDSTAPYKKSPIFKTSSYKLLSNVLSSDTYTVQYTIHDVTISQLKNIILELDWKKSKTKNNSTVSINRARLVVNYEKKTPKWSLYDSINAISATINESVAWKLTAKNTGDCGNGRVELKLPKGVTVNSSSGGGSYNSSSKVWSYNCCKGKTVTRTFYLKSSTVGAKNIVALNDSIYATNLQVSQLVTFNKYVPPISPVGQVPVNRDDKITFTFYDTIAKDDEAYFDINIQGFKENHPFGGACFRLTHSDNIRIGSPLRSVVELLGNNTNVDYLVTSDTVNYGNITVEIADDTFCLKLNDINADFIANIRVPIYCLDDTIGSVTILQGSNTYTGSFDILPPRINKFFSEFEPSRDKQYVQNSVNVGVPNIWTFRAKSSSHNFFDEKKSDFIIAIEKLIAYIGCVPLRRGHRDDEKANITNTLINNTYLNRRYLGKEGDTTEDIPMTLRIPWTDVATLEGLVAMDKPIPINTCPDILDGDPLNHRGWAELTGVKNIRKINNLLYECEPQVTYLTHALLTKFAIIEKGKLTNSTIDYFLSETHTYADNLLEKFSVNYSQFFTNLEDEQGDIVGTYEIEPSTDLRLNSIGNLKNYCNYNIKFRNTLPSLMSEDYDKNWEMAIRVLDKDTRRVLFEHLYNNFKHYDFNNSKVLNQADVTTKVLQGNNYNVLNFDNMVLGYDGLAPLLEDAKAVTHFNTLENTEFNESNSSFELFLLDKSGVGIANQKIELRISDGDNYVEKFDLITDIYGRFRFRVNLENGDYTLECTYNETLKNRSCTYSTNFTVSYGHTNTSFKYYEDFVTFVNDSYYEAILVDENDTPLPNKLVHYSFRDLASESYCHEESLLTNNEGKVLIPIINNNGSKELKVSFKGDNTHNPSFFEDIVDINIQGRDTIIESDDVELVQGDSEKIYNIILKDSNNVVLKNKPVTMCFYNLDENYILNTTTNDYGVANVPIYLNKGAWKVDTVFKGDNIYKPVINTNNVWINEYEQLGTKILSENIVLDETKIIDGEQDYYTLSLVDENNNPVRKEPISILVYNNDKSVKYVDVVLETNDNGVLEVPFVSHGETVLIESTYYGCNQYSGSYLHERVSFEENHIKTDVNFHVVEDTSDPNDVYREIFLTEGTYNDHVLMGVFDGKYDIIVNYPNNKRIVNIGGNYLASLNKGTYKVTFVYHGTSNYYPQMRTIEYVKPHDTRQDWEDILPLQGLDNTYDYSYELENSYEVGSLASLKLKFNFELPKSLVYVGGGYSGPDEPTTLNSLTNDSEYVLTINSYKWNSELGSSRSYVDFDFIVPNNGEIIIFVPPTDFSPAYSVRITLPISTNTKNNTNIIENGFGRYNRTYQDMFISTDSAGASNNELINEYFIAKVINTNTFEELYYYSYLINKETITKLKFLLEKGDWILNILTKETSNYRGAVYTASAMLNTNTQFGDSSLDPLFTYTDWIDKGDISIENKLDNENDKIETISYNELLNSVLNRELTTSNNYKLSFDLTYQYNKDNGQLWILTNNIPTYAVDGVWVALDKIYEYNNNVLINNVTLTQPSTNGKVRISIERKGAKLIIYFDDTQMYISNNAKYNNFGIVVQGQGIYAKLDNFELIDSNNITEIINPSTSEDNESLNTVVFGSDVHLELKKNRLSLVDYGMLPDGELGTGKIILNDIQLPMANYELELWINYNNNRFERLNNLEGLVQMNIFEDVSLADSAVKYNNIQCSPVAVPNSITRFTRLCDEGTLYYIEKPLETNPKYLCDPYIQYKGGTDLKTETGISIFDLDNAYSPVMLSNGLVRAEFHRRSGYIVVSRFDESTESWYKCNTFKLSGEPNLALDENYNDDKATVRFGDTKWTMWRGRPFIKLEHPNTDLRILDLVDRVYCETTENEFSMGFVEEHDTTMSIFNPRMTIQQFKQELHIGQNIKLDNFTLYSIDGNNNESELVTNAELAMTVANGDNAIEIVKNEGGVVGLNFPSNPNYVRKPGNTFSLLLGYIMNHNEEEIIVKARGYDDRGKIPVKEELQYGIWESSQTLQLADNGETDEIRVTFTNVPPRVKYVDFLLIFSGNSHSNVVINQIMLYEGDSLIGYDIDTSKANAALVEINFIETYYACLYDDDSPCGLAIVRPNRKKFSLRKLEANDETVLIPYMKKYAEHDAVENILLEYFNSKNQTINVDWGG